ncbi:hypothetical protein DM02DRAFT_665857 [Periconia macrospinosa]|uniref:Dolichyl-diphosphooligosaccharide--protein glycosyltransferase subunit 4 n=1 Tax=Periconia macrospinosa TaxID=97972 RepID=A0A2V1ED37_9PLEO|nr:hypothetical protein DM02DRAFT_665857 [Periconia macrospinosa]
MDREELVPVSRPQDVKAKIETCAAITLLRTQHHSAIESSSVELPNCAIFAFPHASNKQAIAQSAARMITDSQLYSLAIFLGSAAMFLIVVYHFLEVNSEDHVPEGKPRTSGGKVKA